MRNQIGEVNDDDFVLLVFLATGIAGGGMFAIAKLLAPVREWMTSCGLLTHEDVVVDLGEGQGLDMLRITAVVALVVMVIALGVLLVRRRKPERIEE